MSQAALNQSMVLSFPSRAPDNAIKRCQKFNIHHDVPLGHVAVATTSAQIPSERHVILGKTEH